MKSKQLANFVIPKKGELFIFLRTKNLNYEKDTIVFTVYNKDERKGVMLYLGAAVI